MTPKFAIVFLLLVISSLSKAVEDETASSVADSNDSESNDDKKSVDDKEGVRTEETTDVSDKPSTEINDRKQSSDDLLKESGDKLQEEYKDSFPTEPVTNDLTSENPVNLEFLERVADKSEVFTRDGKIFKHSGTSDDTFAKNAEEPYKLSSESEEVEEDDKVAEVDENNSEERESRNKVELHDKIVSSSQEKNAASDDKTSLAQEENPPSPEKSEIGFSRSTLEKSAQNDHIHEKSTSSNEKSSSSQTSDSSHKTKSTNVDKSENSEEKSVSDLSSEMSSKHEAATARRDKDEDGSDDKPNIERLGYSQSGESGPYRASKRFLSLPEFPMSHQDSPFGLFGAFGSRRNYQRDLISSHPSGHQPPLPNPLFNPNSFNLQSLNPPSYRNHPDQHSRRNFAQDDMVENNFDPFSNSYPLSPDEGFHTANVLRDDIHRNFEVEIPAHKYGNLQKYSNYSPITHPLYLGRERRNANNANASPFVGYFKGLFDNFKVAI